MSKIEIKCISVKLPWAAMFFVAPWKDAENRGWQTKHRGPLLIHASKGIDRQGDRMLDTLGLITPDVEKLMEFTGCALGIVDQYDCTFRPDNGDWEGYEHAMEGRGDRSFSDWHQADCWGHYYRHSRLLKQPIPMKGALGIFNTSLELPGDKRL